MDFFIDLCGLLGVWLLFTFPLYQACLELSAQAIAFKKQVTSKIASKKNFSLILDFSASQNPQREK